MLRLPKARAEAAKSNLCFKALLVSTDSLLTHELELLNHVQPYVDRIFIEELGLVFFDDFS